MKQDIKVCRNLYTTRKKSTNYKWFKIDLNMYKNGISKDCKYVGY